MHLFPVGSLARIDVSTINRVGYHLAVQRAHLQTAVVILFKVNTIIIGTDTLVFRVDALIRRSIIRVDVFTINPVGLPFDGMASALTVGRVDGREVEGEVPEGAVAGGGAGGAGRLDDL